MTILKEKPKQKYITKEQLEANICRQSFYKFVQKFWHVIEPSTIPIWNWHIEYLCNEAQDLAFRYFNKLPKEYDLIINVSPGSTKSIIFSVMFPIWLWIIKPSTKVICGSYTNLLSLKLAGKSQLVLESDKFKLLFPEIQIKKDTPSLLINTNTGERIATSTGSSIVGSHGDFQIIDDPIDPASVLSEAMLRTTIDWMKNTLPTRKVNLDVPLILIMQRLHENDPTGWMLERAENKEISIKHICLPARESNKVRPKRLRKKYVNGLMDSVRTPELKLKEQEKLLGRYGFSGQYEQNPVPPEGGLFEWKKVKIEEPRKSFNHVVRYWDKAGTQGGGAYSVGVLMGLDIDKRYCILDVIRGQWASQVREEIILNSAISDYKAYGKRIIGTKPKDIYDMFIEQEGGSGGKESAENTIRNLAGFRVYADIPKGNKEQRAYPFSIQVNNGNVYLKPGAWNRDYLSEMEYFPFSKFKDQIDASSGAFSKLTFNNVEAGGLF